ncbi:MAG: AmmeMemoRadiSam system protein A [Leptonema sp. (in: bacteria)]
MQIPHLTNEEKEILKKIAYESIGYGFEHNQYLLPRLENLPKILAQKGASFVTLYRKDLPIHKNLRGCIGSLIPKDPLAKDVAKNAYSAAFSDPRFLKLTKEEFQTIEIKISLLSPLEKIYPKSFDDLLDSLKPKLDGLYLKTAEGSATFLPDVWDKVSDAKEFLKELYKKADLEIHYPFDKIEWFRYTTTTF